MGGRIPHSRFGQDDRTDEKGVEGGSVAGMIKKIEKVCILYYILYSLWGTITECKEVPF